MIKHSKARINLLKSLPKQSVGAEIGVFRGNFSENILKIVNPLRLYLVDPWEYNTELEEGFGADVCGSQLMMDSIYNEAQQKLCKYSTVTIYRMSSLLAVTQIPYNLLHWVYIDASHLYESVKEDLTVWTDKVKEGGYICGDDYGSYPGVTQAVNEWINGSIGLKLIYKNVGNQFLVVKGRK